MRKINLNFPLAKIFKKAYSLKISKNFQGHRECPERMNCFGFQGWISDMGIDGPTFVPKSGYFLLILFKVCPQKLAFS